MIECAIFDMDGVVVDTVKYHFWEWQRLSRQLGFEITEKDNEQLRGVTRTEGLEKVLRMGGITGVSPGEKEEMSRLKNQWHVEYLSALTADDLLPNVANFICKLKEHGIKIALGSSSTNANLILNRTGIIDLFDAVVDGNSTTHSKPDPEVFLKGALECGCNPSNCLVFEDAIAGVTAAHRGGMTSVGVGNHQVKELANYFIDSFEGVGYEQFLQFKKLVTQ